MDTIEEGDAGEGDGSADSAEPQVYLPGQQSLQEGEELVHDSSTYHMYHVVCMRLYFINCICLCVGRDTLYLVEEAVLCVVSDSPPLLSLPSLPSSPLPPLLSSPSPPHRHRQVLRV